MRNNLCGDIIKSPKLNSILNGVREGKGPFAAFGMDQNVNAYFAVAAKQYLNQDVLVITHSQEAASRLFEDVLEIDDSALFFPSRSIELRPVSARSSDSVHERISVLSKVCKQKPRVVVASIDAVLIALSPPSVLNNYITTIESSGQIDVDSFLESMISSGYERVDRVEGVGQIALRGGILDIFAVGQSMPVRAELFGDVIESLRSFDVQTQVSIMSIKKLNILSATEAPITEDSSRRAIEIIDKFSQDCPNSAYVGELERSIELLSEHQPPENVESIIPLLYDELAIITNYLSKNSVCLLQEPTKIHQKANTLFEEFISYYESRKRDEAVIDQQIRLMLDYESLIMRLDAKRSCSMQLLKTQVLTWNQAKKIDVNTLSFPDYHGHPKELAQEVKKLTDKNYRVWFLCGTKKRAKRVQDMMMDEWITVVLPRRETDIVPGMAVAVEWSLYKGFILDDAKIAVITENEIFGTRKHRAAHKRQSKNMMDVFADLNIGDYVVHDNNGIGIFMGIEQLVVDSVKKDYLLIKYSGSDRLYVPSEQMEHVQKFIGSDKTKAKLSKLGTAEWSRTKAKVSESVRELAFDLLELYAKRKAKKGFQFSKDTPWQREFEDNFAFEETQDQISSIIEIKNDMEDAHCMERLLCGDVGYGKTEVAMRAAFKAISDSKQVAMLVPTTVLAQQHYLSFLQRFQGFPITIESLSRFKTAREQKQIIERIKQGSVDIVIGTHRLLNKDVVFKDLGLLIIDEEQRFGVGHKETIKTLKENVDVLMLSATPIPRTLHMSLSGIRDMSLLSTPPEERYPVETLVLEYSDSWACEVIMREVNRNGQIYFVYNHVKDIDRFMFRLQDLLPGVRIAVAHGQMKESLLEKVMLSFYSGEYDVLLCSTIIESGLDIPNVNTIIVYDADNLGLAQLYQLRGRVGRSNRHAYAYFTFKKDKVVSEIAEKRLTAIREFTEFGAGFKIAMRDLEIRGAGNVLGPQQHGHMSEVGYDMYCKLIDKAVREIKGEVIAEPVITNMDVAVSAFIPQKYISDDYQKIESYKRIASIETNDQAEALKKEFRDRFGAIPECVENLFDIAIMKWVCMQLRVEFFSCKDGLCTFKFHKTAKLHPSMLIKLVDSNKKMLSLTQGENIQVNLRRKIYNAKDMLGLAMKCADKLKKCLIIEND